MTVGCIYSQKFIWGGGGPLGSPFQNPPSWRGGGGKGRLFYHVFHAYPMTKPLALSQSVPVPVTVTVSLRGLLLRLSAVLLHPRAPPPPPHQQVGAKIFRHLH